MSKWGKREYKIVLIEFDWESVGRVRESLSKVSTELFKIGV